MENNRQNVLYIINEYMYLTCAFFLLGFSTYNYAPEVRYQIGWFYIAFLGVILGFNVLIMLADISISIRIAFLKRRSHKKV